MKNVYVVALNAIPFLPYVYGLLRSCAEADPSLAETYRFPEPVFLWAPTRDLLEQLPDPAVVGFSCYVWNFMRSMKLARLLKERNPDVLTVVGGPHVPDVVGDFLQQHPYIDVLVHGEGEWTFRELLARYATRASPHPCDFGDVAGITYRGPRGVVTTPRRASAERFITLPSAYTTGYLDAAIELCRRRGLRFYAPWETNRGCPFSCAFCDWGSSTMSRVRLFPDEQLSADIAYFAARSVPNVFICDANFGMLGRDVDIAAQLGGAHAMTGYPQQVRVNFAKNSNDRVFEISRIFERHSMLMGTTLSVQSMDSGVLEAIDRANIGVKRFAELHERYKRAGISTYTELIVGLPRETRASFFRGLGELLEAGNHEDLRVFDFMLLPNAPINTPAARERYGFDTIIRPLFVDPAHTRADEREMGEFVIGTTSMSRADWCACAVFATLIQILHNGCFTRYLAIHIRREYGLAYDAFYERLLAHAQTERETILGEVVAGLAAMYRCYLRDASVPQVNLVASQPTMSEKLERYGRRRGWTPDNWGWLCIASNHDRFYREVAAFVLTLGVRVGKEIDDLLRFQSDIILRESYDPAEGKSCHYNYDFPAYFAGPGPLRTRPTAIHYADTHMGVNHQYPLVAGDPKRFAKAAIGESYPFVRIRHYQHQLESATVSFSEPAFTVTGGETHVAQV